MAWIESHQAIGQHPKTILLARLLKCSLPAAVGHLHFLWWWAIDYAPDGHIGAFDAAIIAHACQWRGSPTKFLEALHHAKFVDSEQGEVVIHDWFEYAGRLVERRQKDAERKRTARGHPATVPQTSNGVAHAVHSPSGVPYQPDQPDRTNHTGTPQPPSRRGRDERRKSALPKDVQADIDELPDV